MEMSLDLFEKGDYDKVKSLFWKKGSLASEDCVLGIYVWKDRYDFELVSLAGGWVLHSRRDDRYMFPMPMDRAQAVMEELLAQRESLDLYRITEEQKQFLEEHFPGKFTWTADEGSFDYLYEAEVLAELRGKKLAKKRNHVNAFLTTWDQWLVEPISEKNVSECMEFAEEWYMAKEEDLTAGRDSLSFEKEAVMRVLSHYGELDCDGILLRIEGKCVAFTVGQRISPGAYDVVFEKADESTRGAYNMINREFVRYLRRKYPDLKYVNRENDLGLEGLRRAKRSYAPTRMLEKYEGAFRKE